MAGKPRKAKAAAPGKPEPDKLLIDNRYLKPGEKEKFKNATDAEIAVFMEEVAARALSQPEVRAAAMIQKYEGDSMNVNALVNELRQQVAEVNAGNMARPEAMLVAQAHSLDALFSNLARRSHANSSGGYLDAAATYLKLALRAQAQAVRTLEVLSEMKNPRPVAFVRQANISNGPQQINNGVPAPSRAREIENEQTQLSGESHELLPNTRASGDASRVNPALETLGEINRAKVPRG